MATQCEGNKSDKKLRQIAEGTKKKSKKGKKQKTTAEETHVKVSQNPVDETKAYSATGPDASTKATTESAQEAAGESKGLLSHMKKDFELTKDFLSGVGGTLSGDAMKAEAEAGAEVAADAHTGKGKFERLKQQGGDYLSKMGRDSKIYGGAKIAGYMVGTSMLLDMLNPFDDD